MRENIKDLIAFGIILMIYWLLLLAIMKIPEATLDWIGRIILAIIVIYLMVSSRRQK